MDPETILSKPEGKTLEFTRDLSSPIPVLKTVVAFSNSAGGSIVFGVEDGTRRIVGVSDPFATEGRIVNIVSDGVRPQICPEVEMVSIRDRVLLVVNVYPGPNRPYHLTALGREKGT
jgi:predicted HTH transcriptional regulator